MWFSPSLQGHSAGSICCVVPPKVRRAEPPGGRAGPRRPERALWCPDNTTATFDYYIFADEEVYWYCVTNSFIFSDLFQDGHLAFTGTEMEATEFAVDLQQY